MKWLRRRRLKKRLLKGLELGVTLGVLSVNEARTLRDRLEGGA